MVGDFIASRRTSSVSGGGGRVRHGDETAVAQVDGESLEKRKSAARRSSEETAALSERLYDTICSKPGEKMAMLGTSVVVAPREVLVPSARLRAMPHSLRWRETVLASMNATSG
jgi:hypothetical protein